MKIDKILKFSGVVIVFGVTSVNDAAFTTVTELLKLQFVVCVVVEDENVGFGPNIYQF